MTVQSRPDRKLYITVDEYVRLTEVQQRDQVLVLGHDTRFYLDDCNANSWAFALLVEWRDVP